MLTRLAVLAALSSVAGAPLLVSAQDKRGLDPSVSSVISGGNWEQGKQHGTYRIIVHGGGFWRRVPSTLRVEWIIEDAHTRARRVLTSSAVDSIPDGAWSLSQPHFNCETGACRFTIYGVDPQTDQMKGESWAIALRGPGQMSVVKRPTSIRPDWCVAEGSTVDSVFVVAQALSVLEDTLLPLRPYSVRRVEEHIGSLSLLEGFLVSLMPTRPMGGGGGLVWVDSETGCPILIKAYE